MKGKLKEVEKKILHFFLEWKKFLLKSIPDESWSEH